MTPRELAEEEGKPIAVAWIDASIRALEAHCEWVVGADEPGSRRIVESALATNFSISARGLSLLPWLWWITGMYRSARQVLERSDAFFFDATDGEARELFGASGLPPAYAIFERGVFFTTAFAPWDPARKVGFGPQCRAAMVLHESIHVVDPRSGEPEIHISEWDEPAFSAQSAEASIRNPSAYASFGAQVYTRSLDWPRSARYGAGSPAV